MSSAVEIAYFSLHVTTAFSLPLLALTFLLPSGVKRHASITNNLLLWATHSTVASLLLLSGNRNNQVPPHALCQFQSTFMYGGPPALAQGSLALVLRVWHLTWSVKKTVPFLLKHKLLFDVSLVSAPWLVWILVSAIAGATSNEQAYRHHMYCTSDDARMVVLSGTMTAASLVLACSLQAWTVALVSKRYRSTRRLSQSETGHMDLGLFLRILVYSSIMLFGLVLTIVTLARGWSSLAPDMALATIGPIVFLLFGSQLDVLVCWGLKRCQSQPAPGGVSDLVNKPTPVDNCPSHKTIRIPLTLNALYRHKASNTKARDGPQAQQGDCTLTNYDPSALRTLNENVTTTIHSGHRDSHITVTSSIGGSEHYSLKALQEGSARHYPSASTQTANSDGISVRMTFGPSSVPASPVDSIDRSSHFYTFHELDLRR